METWVETTHVSAPCSLDPLLQALRHRETCSARRPFFVLTSNDAGISSADALGLNPLHIDHDMAGQTERLKHSDILMQTHYTVIKRSRLH